MAKNIGECALCRKTNIELMQSHIIPKAIYKRTKVYKESIFRNYYNIKTIYQDGEKKPMLCHDCEEFFSRYERKFTNTFLDKYLKSPDKPLPAITEDIEFYMLTVAWRVLYDDLYVCDSYQDDTERKYFEEFENKLGKFIFEKYIEKNPDQVNTRNTIYEPDFEGKCFGEIIAEIEKHQNSISPEDISEIKNYIYKLSDLGLNDSAVKLSDLIVFGYSLNDCTRTKYYVITGYKGLIITTVYLRKRSNLLTDDKNLLNKDPKSEEIIKKDITDEINDLFKDIYNHYPDVQKELEESGLGDKIKNRYLGKQKLK